MTTFSSAAARRALARARPSMGNPTFLATHGRRAKALLGGPRPGRGRPPPRPQRGKASLQMVRIKWSLLWVSIMAYSREAGFRVARGLAACRAGSRKTRGGQVLPTRRHGGHITCWKRIVLTRGDGSEGPFRKDIFLAWHLCVRSRHARAASLMLGTLTIFCIGWAHYFVHTRSHRLGGPTPNPAYPVNPLTRPPTWGPRGRAAPYATRYSSTIIAKPRHMCAD